MAEIDERYKRGKIYTIRCRYDDTLIYVGSTIDTLAKRMGGHKNKSTKVIYPLYKKINNDWDNWFIELYENYPCNNKQELLKREGEVTRQIGNLNKQIASRTKSQYYEDNKETLYEKQKIWNMVNNEKKIIMQKNIVITIKKTLKIKHEKK